MPFQSEKQRRFLHANHPEIAKRWEREYAHGGISNHFRKKYSLGEGPVMEETDNMDFLSSLTQEEVDQEPEKYAQLLIGLRKPDFFMGEGANQRAYFIQPDNSRISVPWGFFASPYEQTIDFKNGGRIGYDEGGIVEWFHKNIKKIGKVPGTNKSILETMKQELDLYRMLWRLDKEKKKLFKSYRDTNVQSGLLEKHAEMQKFNELYQHELANQPKDSAQNGILDIDASEEIISDDGNDIELTDYNAAFDDPNDLSTGVKSLFQAKDGGRIGLYQGGGPHGNGGSKNGKTGNGGNGKDYGPYSKGPPTKTKTKGSDRGPLDDPDFAPTKDTSPKDDDAREKYISTSPIAKKRYKESITHHPSIDGPIVTKIRDFYGPGYQERAPKTKEEKTLLDKIAWGIAIYTGLAPFLGLKVPGIVTTFGKVLGYREEIDYALSKAYDLGLINKNVTTDSLADNFVENFKNKTAKKAEYDSLPTGHPDKIALGIELQIGKTTDDGDRGDDGPHLPDVVPIGEEIQEYESIAPDAATTLASMRSKQALRTMLNPDWQLTAEARELKNNPIVMTANSGGLANLFRVKNQ